MKKLNLLFIVLLLVFTVVLNATTPAIKTSTAWFNAENFESFTAGTDLKAAGESAYSDWTGTNVMAGIMQLSANPTTSTASNLIFGFPTGTTLATTFADGSTSGTLNITKSAFNGGALTGYVYLKTSFFFQTYGCYYVLKNAAGDEVFRFGGLNNNANAAMYCTGITNTTVAMGNRGNWGDIECVLDLNNKLIKKITFSYLTNAASPKSWTDIPLTNGTDISTLYLSVSRRSGLDNTTIGQLIADNIQDMTASQINHQTTDGTANTSLNVTPISTSMGLVLPFTEANTDVDVIWSISDWGTLSEADKALVSVTRSTEDYCAATLTTTGSVSTDADITVSAVVADGAALTKVISLKSNSIDGVKSSLLSEISKATGIRDAVTASNPYISALKTDLTTVINTGQGVYDNASVTISDVTTATANLITAESTFNAGMKNYSNYTAYVETVVAGRDTVGVNYPSSAFFTAIKNTLNISVDVAVAAKDTISSVNSINNATSVLATAYASFNADRPAYYTLGSQIATVTSRYNAVFPRKGDTKFLQFTSSSVDALASAMNTASDILNTATTASDLSAQTATLASALTTFNNTARIAPSTSDYRIYSYGSSGGDGDGVKKVLFAHKINNTPAYRLAWCNLTDAKALVLGDSALWTITQVETNKYSFKNKALNLNLNGTSFKDSTILYSLNEVKSQNGYINGFIDWSTKSIADPNFIYAMVSGVALEIRADSVAPYSNLRTGSTADRYRFAFQFEEAIAPSVSTIEGLVEELTCNINQTDISTLTLSGDNLFGFDIQLGITGVNADAFSVSTTEISPSNTYVRNYPVTVSYSPHTYGQHYAKLSIAVTGGSTLEYDLTGSVITTSVDNNKFNQTISVSNGILLFEAKAGDDVTVYTITGTRIASLKAVEGMNTIGLQSKGVMIVQIGNRINKVVL